MPHFNFACCTYMYNFKCSGSLELQLGRYSGIDRDNRLCQFCNVNGVESEYHLLLECIF